MVTPPDDSDHPLLAVVRTVRPFLGSLVVVPLVVILFGGQWIRPRSLMPARAMLVKPSEGVGEARREVRLHFYDDGADPGRGIRLAGDSFLLVDLSRPIDRFVAEVQVDWNDVYQLLGSADGERFELLWEIERGRRASHLTTRRSSWIEPDIPVRFLEVRGLRGNPPYFVSALRLELEPTRIPQAMLIPAVWGSWLLLWLAGRGRPGKRASRWLDRWAGADAWVAAVLVCAVVLRLAEETLFAVAFVLMVWALLRLLSLWLSRSPASLLLVVVVAGVLAWILPKLFAAVIVAKIAQLHDLTVDHRPLPGPEINSDRIRFAGEAADLADDEFVVFFLGDSFTYGLHLDYQDSYPYTFERIVSGYRCSQPVRAINAGWTSASPLLALRLIQEIGYKYRPQLMIYNLDITDFHDDLQYENRLRTGGDLEIDLGLAATRLLARGVPRLANRLRDLERLRDLFRARDSTLSESGDPPVPEDRFFVTSRPLAETSDAIERGVIRNLQRLYEFSTGTLDGAMAVVVAPRAYQYSLRESPANWERLEYEALGPYVREPFLYFAERAGRLPYPVLSLLPVFAESETFPLFHEDDPHWSEAGARLVAETVARWTSESGLIPCQPGS